MHSFRASLPLLALTILSVNAQNITYSIDPDSVPISTRQNWCQSQIAACPLLCLQNDNATDASTADNECDPDTLDYSCICGSGITPNLNNFSQTIPFFECQEYGNQCVNACAQGDSPCQNACRVDNPCGAQTPTRVNITTTSATNTATATNSGANTVYTGLGGSSSSTKKSGAQTVMDVGQSCGMTLVFAGLFAGFALMM